MNQRVYKNVSIKYDIILKLFTSICMPRHRLTEGIYILYSVTVPSSLTLATVAHILETNLIYEHVIGIRSSRLNLRIHAGILSENTGQV